MKKLFKIMRDRLSAGEDLVLVTVIASSGATPRGAGARMLVGAGGRLCGTIGGGSVEYRSEHIAAERLEKRASLVHDFSLTKDDVQNLGMICGGAVNVYFHFIPAGDENAIAVADEVKETSAGAIAALRSLGFDVRMLTGDNRVTAEAIAHRVGLNSKQVIADVLPADKERHVRELQDAGSMVAMVGDGINDSPALARADVGLAIGTGADIAKEGADVVLMRSDLMDVARAIELSRATIRNIKQDLFWALFYNGIGIPLAVGVFFPLTGWQLSPMFGAAAMSLSSVCVVSNALRLKSFKPKVAK